MATPSAGMIERLRRYTRSNPNIAETVIAFAIKLVGAGLSFGFSFLVARHLGAAGNGSFALALTTALFASGLSLVGLDYVLLRTMAGDLHQGDTGGARGAVRTTVIITGLAAILVGLVLAFLGTPLIAAALGKSLDKQLIILAAIAVLPLTLNRIAVAALRGAGAVLAAQWLEGPQAMLIAALVLLGIIVSGRSIAVDGVVMLYFATAALSALLAWLLYRRTARHWPRSVPPSRAALLRQGWPISLSVLSRLVLDWVVLMMLGTYYSTFEVGQFRTAWQISALIMLLVSTFDTVVGPRIAAAWRGGDIAGIRRIMRHNVVIMSIISLPLFVIALGFPEWALGLFGPEFVAGAPALRILALGQMVNIVSGPQGVVLLMTGHERWALWLALGSVVVLLALSATLIPAYGLIGAALTTALVIGSRTIATSFLVRKVLGAAR